MSDDESARLSAKRRLAALTSLGLGPDAGGDEIRTAYRRLAMRYHPDASGDPLTAKRFTRVVRAFKVLSAAESGNGSLRSGQGQLPTRPRYRSVEDAGSDLFALGQVLAAEQDPGARSAAVRALGLSGRAAAYVFLRRALYDPAEDVSMEAVRAVALLGARQAEGEVAALYSRASDRQKRLILELAAATGERVFRSTLEVASKSEDRALRELALEAGLPTRS